MTIEERMKAEAKEYQTTEPFLLGRLTLMFPADAVKIAKEYSTEMCKRQLALVIAQFRDKLYDESDNGKYVGYLTVRNIIETTKLATEEE